MRCLLQLLVFLHLGDTNLDVELRFVVALSLTELRQIKKRNVSSHQKKNSDYISPRYETVSLLMSSVKDRKKYFRA